MAGSQSFRKRENEKKKQAKRVDKQKRKVERQAAGPSSMDEMIAWVDENGNLTSIPPEERDGKRAEIKLEDIDVSTPRQEYVEVEPLKGLVEYFNSDKGYGFIKDQQSNEKYFFHISNAPQDIAEGKQVTFELERGVRGINAAKIVIIKG